MPEPVAHLAGPPTLFERCARQRCVWCGALILEYDRDRIRWLEPDEEWSPGFWQAGEWVVIGPEGVVPLRVSQGFSDMGTTGNAPEGSCMKLGLSAVLEGEEDR